jgi:acetolactate synthase-1/2/3 large subunit
VSEYEGQLIKKPWGFEWESFNNGAAAVWILHIAAKRKTSLHCHPNKRTVLFVLKGSVQFTTRSMHTDVFAFEGKRAYTDTRVMHALEFVEIPKGQYHQTEAVSVLDGYPSAEDGAWVLEIEEPSDKNDLVRMADEYGREDKPYETEVVPYTGELLRLNFAQQSFMGLNLWLEISADTSIYRAVPDVRIPLCAPGPTLCIAKDAKTVKLSHYVADFIASKGIKHVFGVSGGGCMHLLDSIGNNKDLKYVACHHEQAAAMAAEGYSRLHGIGCALVTTGPGGTNAITGIACAWADSIPVVFISGQVTRDTIIGNTGLRQFGVQESNIVELVKPITKYAATVMNEGDIQFELERAWHIATTGRKGPVWVDIPLDLQAKQISLDHLVHFQPEVDAEFIDVQSSVKRALHTLNKAKRPVLILGNGVNLAGAANEAYKLAHALRIPVITSWGAANLVQYDFPQYIGHMGIFGDRAANYTVQNADVLLVIGCRLSVPMIGYRFNEFAPNAKIIMVDIDWAEITKPSLNVDLAIQYDAKEFMDEMLKLTITAQAHPCDDWRVRCVRWKSKYPVGREFAGAFDTRTYVNSFHFISRLSDILSSYAIVVVDQGTAFTCTMQAFKVKLGQRFVVSGGHAAMGYGLPGAIGAAFATGKPIICIVGDGDFQMNIQELATINHHNLPITIFVLNNQGYGTIKAMQENHFKRYVGSEGSDLSFPEVCGIADAYGIRYRVLPEFDLDTMNRYQGPTIVEVFLDPNQPLIPRISSKKMPDGSIQSMPLERMFPFLPEDEHLENMRND